MRGVFDIVGPVMIGPSSSHTAGAARLGKMARTILGERPVAVDIQLHGSFAQTYKGHGTDKALAAGLLGFSTEDERIRDALDIAQEEGVIIRFTAADFGDVHPNTAAITLKGENGRKVRIVGASVGGGNIVVTEIDGYAVELRGDYNTLITIHQDEPGIISLVTHILAKANVNVAFMRVSRQQRGAQALMLIEADHGISESTLVMIRNIPAVRIALLIPPI